MENYAEYVKYIIEIILGSIKINCQKEHYTKYQLDINVKELTPAEMLKGSFFNDFIYKIPQSSTNIYVRAPPSSMYFTKEILKYMEV